jgi:septal ring factor EnvC (AmiA/AmiB activator)
MLIVGSLLCSFSLPFVFLFSSPSSSHREAQEQHDKEKEQIKQFTQAISQQTTEMQKKIEGTESTLQQERQARLELKNKLKAMEAKLVEGNQLLTLAEKEKRMLAKKKEEAERKRVGFVCGFGFLFSPVLFLSASHCTLSFPSLALSPPFSVARLKLRKSKLH